MHGTKISEGTHVNLPSNKTLNFDGYSTCPRKRGKLLTFPEKEMIFRVFIGLKIQKVTNAFRLTVSLTGIGENTLSSILKEARENGGALKRTLTLTKRGKYKRNIDRSLFQSAIKEYIDQSNKSGIPVTTIKVQQYLRSRGAFLSKTAIRRTIIDIGYKFKSVDGCLTYVDTDDLKKKRKYFLVQREKAKKLIAESPTPELYTEIWMDESYCNQHHVSRFTWRFGSKYDQVKRGNKGRRWILVHAGSKDGWESVPAIWEASKSDGDYHDNMNSENFEKYFERLCKDVKEKGKKAFFMMDNASYHKTYDKKHLKKMKVAELTALLKSEYNKTDDHLQRDKIAPDFIRMSKQDLVNLVQISDSEKRKLLRLTVPLLVSKLKNTYQIPEANMQRQSASSQKVPVRLKLKVDLIRMAEVKKRTDGNTFVFNLFRNVDTDQESDQR
jgi:hypothetical protein